MSTYYAWPPLQEDLISVSAHTCESSIPFHKHDYMEMVIISKGSCIHKYMDIERLLLPGDVFAIAPHEEHSYIINSETVIYNCLFYPEALGEYWDELKTIKGIHNIFTVEPFYRYEEKKYNIMHLTPVHADNTADFLNKMIAEQKNKKEGYKLMLKSYLIMLLTYISRVWESDTESISFYFTEKSNMLAETIKYIESNFNKNLKIESIAHMAFFSPEYFRKIFKDYTGLTPIEYINKLRMSKASSMLDETDLSISEIAYRVGINDVNYFSRIFRALYGCSPTEYRKKKDY